MPGTYVIIRPSTKDGANTCSSNRVVADKLNFKMAAAAILSKVKSEGKTVFWTSVLVSTSNCMPIRVQQRPSNGR